MIILLVLAPGLKVLLIDGEQEEHRGQQTCVLSLARARTERHRVPTPDAEAALKLQREEHCGTKLVMGATARRFETTFKKNPLISSPTPVTHRADN